MSASLVWGLVGFLAVLAWVAVIARLMEPDRVVPVRWNFLQRMGAVDLLAHLVTFTVALVAFERAFTSVLFGAAVMFIASMSAWEFARRRHNRRVTFRATSL